MKTIVTLTALYARTIEIEVKNELLEGKSKEEIAKYLIEEYPFDCDMKELEKQELVPIPSHEEFMMIDEDRFDIYDDDNKHIYGGHL